LTRFSLLLATLALTLSCMPRIFAHPPRGITAPIHSYRVIHAYPHDARAYTQGMIYLDGSLYESTGLYGRSSLRKVNLETGEVALQREVDAQFFAEGLTAWGSSLIQLTWRSHIAFVYDRATLQLRRTLPLAGEGWGLTRDDRALIVSDGTNVLRFLDPVTLKDVRRIAVADGGSPVTQLNELEYVRGEIYANVWHSDRIAVISPESGHVTAWIDLRGLMTAGYRLDPEAVLNGIAYDSAGDRLFVTGKLWPRLFEIRVDAVLSREH
jgi:glutamine cyclotransferase